MTPDGAFDRRLTTWLEEDAAPHAPQGFDDVVTESVNRKRQLPSWATTERWISLETRARFGAVPRAVLVATVLLVLTALSAATLAIGSSLITRDNGLITYTVDGHIWVADADGASPRQLTVGDVEFGAPVWSNDGTRISYEVAENMEGAPRTIMIMSADGSDALDVAGPELWEPSAHRWSPDDSTLYFAGGVEGNSSDACTAHEWICDQRIYAAATDGSGWERIGDPAINTRSPALSPNGETLYFGGSLDSDDIEARLYRMDADGSNVETIGDIAGGGFSFWRVDVSPDGRRLVTQAGDRQMDVFVVDVESGEHQQLTTGGGHDWDAVWSPDGGRIAFIGDGKGTVVLEEAGDGSFVEHRLGLYLERPRWSPDGTSIIGQDPSGRVVQVDVMDGYDVVDPVEVPGSEDAGDFDWQPVTG